MAIENISDTARWVAVYRAMETARPDAIFGYNDPTAAGAMKAILERGLRIPQDIKVIGVGNFHYSDRLRVPLSTIDQSSDTIGRLVPDEVQPAGKQAMSYAAWAAGHRGTDPFA